MTAPLPDGPFFVPPYVPEHGGVDFLGLRQVNLELMAACLPGINNVTVYLRAFSVLAWVHWKFHRLAEVQGAGHVSTGQLRAFRERAEVLFSWGHVLEGIGRLPGGNARPPVEGGAVPLAFSEWKRTAETSLMAAVQYGPASKTPGGLGFLEAVEGGFFRTCGEGVALAEALDEALAGCPGSGLLGWEGGWGTEADARGLLAGWSVLTPTRAERAAFRRAFFDADAVGRDDAQGRRSATLALARAVLASVRRPLSLDEVRRAMVYGRDGQAAPFDVPAPLQATRSVWTVLQVRQTQRLAVPEHGG